MRRTTRVLPLLLVGSLALGALTSAPGTAAAPKLNGHTVVLNAKGGLLPWNGPTDRAYAGVSKLAWTYLLDRVPNDSDNGEPAYLSHSYMDPISETPVGWPHNPAGLYAMLIESALSYHAYSGDTRVLTLAQEVADHQLANGMTDEDDAWSHVPYASGDSGSLTYAGAAFGDDPSHLGSGDGVGVIEPDKVGELGHGFAQLYELTGEQRYLDAAIDAADALAEHRRTGNATTSVWPFRVQAADDMTREPYSASVTGPIELFDDLIRLDEGDTASYVAARQAVWDWTMTYPMVTDDWSQYFEDVEQHLPPDENLNQLTAMMFARYLLDHPASDQQWETHVRHLIAWVEETFGEPQQGRGGALTINEQQAFYHPMGSHTARYASVNALLYQRTGDLTARRKAIRSFAWATYMADKRGVVIDGPEVGNQWFTDGYGDYVRHFMVGMSALPETAPNGQTHLLRSSSVVSEVTYRSRKVTYTVAAPGTERIKTATTPASVSVDGTTLPRGKGAGTWSYDAASHLLVVRRGAGAGASVTVSLPKGTSVS